ncbi:MAG TPA: DUF1127 domain-containing protein [Dongiaceae bacterium]|nr:DUF1127 domain-containing protein [Dongiaceae bacterium]
MLRDSLTTAATASVHSGEARWFGQARTQATTWLQRRRSRRALAELDERLLRDIGLSPTEAVAESAMPFWRPFLWLQRK